MFATQDNSDGLKADAAPWILGLRKMTNIKYADMFWTQDNSDGLKASHLCYGPLQVLPQMALQ